VRTADILIASILICFSAAMLFVVVPVQIPEGFGGSVSPRLVPQAALWGIFALALLILIRAVSGYSTGIDRITRFELLALIAIPALMLGTTWLLPFIGPLGAGALLVSGGGLLMGERNPLILAAQTAGMLLLGYVLIYVILGSSIG